ncbi:MAG: FAD-dependent oxidoreductase [Deltaproteobacteria bacterium]|nr:FAD-dependent oxidoreductase [Deltaproteobacteria bacterium]MBW2417863.1 FAD-dependent oxidoreductase [Deltaproteobacteria bacterium]
MSAPHVVVVGGGLAGLRAAVSCLDAGTRVTLLEARPRLGGATWSNRHQGLLIDNGQHVFLRCCSAYREFLRRLDVEDRVFLQDRLAVPVAAPGGPTAWLRRSALPAPLHLAGSLLRFSHLSLAERLRVARTTHSLGRLRLSDPSLDEQSFGSWLRARGEGTRSLEVFWDLLVRPTLNVSAEEASLGLAAKVFQTGLLERADAGDIGWSRVPLQELHAEPAQALLERGGAEVVLRAPVSRILPGADGRHVVVTGERRIDADAVILAAPHEVAAELIPEAAGVDVAGLRSLGHAPIVDLHMVFDRKVMAEEFVAGIGTPLQWIFDRSAASGLESGQYLAVSLSAADAYVGVSSAELQRIFLPELQGLFPAAREARLVRFFATCERTATFLQVPGTLRHRPGTRTELPGFYLAGAWTDTGWPATMEGAVLSGEAAAQHALTGLARGRRPAAAAA